MNLVFISPSLMTFAVFLPNWKGFPPGPIPAGPPPPMPPKSSRRPAINQAIGPAKRPRNSNGPPLTAPALCITTSTLFWASLSKRASPTEAFGTKFTSCRLPSLAVYWAVTMSFWTLTISTLPLSTCCKNSEYVTSSSAFAGCTEKAISIAAVRELGNRVLSCMRVFATSTNSLMHAIILASTSGCSSCLAADRTTLLAFINALRSLRETAARSAPKAMDPPAPIAAEEG
mmetsp:Transcript_58143/g.135962  ORF Transcript_58143/g.135962 Transcript_58143/m.135962 type:complete len:230 (-) Transcript_58143:242-931(-)